MTKHEYLTIAAKRYDELQALKEGFLKVAIAYMQAQNKAG